MSDIVCINIYIYICVCVCVCVCILFAYMYVYFEGWQLVFMVLYLFSTRIKTMTNTFDNRLS